MPVHGRAPTPVYDRLRRTRGLRRATFGVGTLALALGALAGLLFRSEAGIGFGARSRGLFQHTPLVRFEAIALELLGGTAIGLRAFLFLARRRRRSRTLSTTS